MNYSNYLVICILLGFSSIFCFIMAMLINLREKRKKSKKPIISKFYDDEIDYCDSYIMRNYNSIGFCDAMERIHHERIKREVLQGIDDIYALNMEDLKDVVKKLDIEKIKRIIAILKELKDAIEGNGGDNNESEPESIQKDVR